MGAMLLAAGTKGKRRALPNARIMIHQVSGGAQGQNTDIQIQARETARIREKMDQLLAKHTGQPVEKVTQDTERDNFMGPEEALAYGIVDAVITSHKETDSK
jgi:ATP-dependent Clp protease protease subunit